MEASPAQIIEFFSGFKQSVIPLFQRPYEWQDRHWGTLWQDVLERYEAEKDLSHFMGAIVTMPAKSVPVGVSKHMVIDGQQRLTSIAVLLCAIRDELPADAMQKKRIQNHYLTNDGYEDWENLKILPTQLSGDRSVFRTLVRSEATDGASNIFSSYKYFRERLKGKTSPMFHWLRQLVTRRPYRTAQPWETPPEIRVRPANRVLDGRGAMSSERRARPWPKADRAIRAKSNSGGSGWSNGSRVA
jgi:hypothetical protein